MLSGRTQRGALPRHQSEEMEIYNLSKYFISSNGDRTHNQSVVQLHFVPLRHGWPLQNHFIQNNNIPVVLMEMNKKSTHGLH